MTTIILSELAKPKHDSAADSVLLVDPDLSWRTAMAVMLRGNGYRLIEAGNTTEAKDKCTDERPAVAVVDYDLADLSAIQLLLHLNAVDYVPVICLSASPDEEMANHALEAGAFFCAAKPLPELQLLAIIRSALHHAFFLRGPPPARQADARLSEIQLRIINIVTGLLMERLNIGQHDAYGRLRQYARSQRTKVIDVAHRLLEASEHKNQLFASIGAMPSCNETVASSATEPSGRT